MIPFRASFVFFQAEDGIRDDLVTGVQTCALPILGVFSMQGTSLHADANVKITNDKLYFKLNEVPVLPFIDAGDLKGKWLSTDVTNTRSEERRVGKECKSQSEQ